MDNKKPNNDSPTKKKNPTSTFPVHESHVAIPQVASAPPSGNFNYTPTTTSQLPSAATMSDPLSVQMKLPPPPPPPPPPRSRGTPTSDPGLYTGGPTRVTIPGLAPSATTSTTTTTMTPDAGPSTAFSLPPPPTVSPVPVQNVPIEFNAGAQPYNTGSALPPPPSFPPPPRSSTGGMSQPSTTVPSSPPPPPPPPPPPLPPTSEQPPVTVPSNINNDGIAAPSPTTSPPPFVSLDTFAPKTSQMLARRQTHVPVLVISTEAANQVAWKNNLQLVDLFQGIANDLRPSSSSSSSHAVPPFRSIHRSIVPTNVRMQFVGPNQLDAHSHDDALDVLSDNARIRDRDGNIAHDLVLLEDRVDELLQERNTGESLRDATRDAFQLTSPLDLPWLVRYRYALDATTDALPHDLINCPPLILLVCTTNEIEAPQQVLQELYNSPDYFLPTAFKNGLFDPQAVRHEVLVLHDSVDGPTDLNDGFLRQSLQSMFGPNAAVLRVNSVPHETAALLMEQEETDPWGGDGRRGIYLSQNDRVLLRRYFQSLLTTSVLPALERRIADLNTIVNERKKGVKNLMKSFWRQPKEKGTGTSIYKDQPGAQDMDESVVRYRYDTIEAQTRLLADTLFLIQDYDAALSMYRLIRDDYKSDKEHSHYASCQEMMALCLFQLDSYNRGREIFSHLETALLSYTRGAEEERARMNNQSSLARPSAAPHSTRLATRLCLLLASPSASAMTAGREVEVADLLASASSHESPLGAAVLLEQSSAFYYQAGMYRKYAFHTLMSGHMFRTAGQDHHAFRCFTSALYVYRHGGWCELHNHLRSALAAQLYTMERYAVALILYAKLVGTSSGGKVSAKSQAKFLQHLLEICTEHTKSALAGADRMLSPPNIPRREREAYRNSRLEKIVSIIRHSTGAARVLELPYVSLPHIVDSSVKIWTHAEEHFVGPEGHEKVAETGSVSADMLGTPTKGVEKIWKDMELTALAEWRAVDDFRPQLDETLTAALAKIVDPTHRKVIAEIDKERQNQNLIERNRRSGTRKPTATVRSRGEPIFCDFVVQNPLSVDIEVTQVQIVASMDDLRGRICTNEFAIEFREDRAARNDPFLFASTGHLCFSVPQFCRIAEPDGKAYKPALSEPFFVVTKESLTLSAGEEVVLSAGLTPLVEGNLQILGVRFKLSDRAWIYHPFEIQGPLLKDNRTNIMNRVRGESMLLKSKVECDMPCLTAELKRRISADSPSDVSDGGPLLDGQISDWTIRLRNVGTAPASNILLKTNLPWINIVENNHQVAPMRTESSATSYCLGPSGTLMALPIQAEGLSSSGTIQPGESVDIHVRIRTCGCKQQDFYMLYRYDLSTAREASKCRSRWLRKVFSVKVFPSISLKANVLRSSWNGRDMIMAVEMTNNRTDRPTDLFVTLDRLSLISRRYGLEIVRGQFTTDKQVGDVLQIGWQERVTVHYRLCSLPKESSSCLLNEACFSEEASCVSKACAESDAAQFLCLDQSNADFEKTWKAHQLELIRIENMPEHEKEHPRSIASIRRANTSAMDDDSDFGGEHPNNHPTSIATLCPLNWKESKAHLICSWRAILGQQVVHGENHIRNIQIRPSTESQLHTNPLVAHADHPVSVVHDFSSGKPALVNMIVSFTNILIDRSLEFFIVVAPKAGFELVGPHMQRLTLDPSSELSLPFKTIIPQSGIYNLQCLQVKIRQEGDIDCTYQLSDQWLVRVGDSSSS